MSLSQNSIALDRTSSKTIPNCVVADIQLHLIDICSKTFPNCVLAEIQFRLIEISLRQFQNLS